MHTGWMVPPRAAHSRVSAPVGRRSVAAGGAPGEGGAADVGGTGDSFDDGAGDDGAGAGRMLLLSTAAGGFGPEVHPTRTTTATELTPRIRASYPAFPTIS